MRAVAADHAVALETFKEHWSLPIDPLPVPEKERLRA